MAIFEAKLIPLISLIKNLYQRFWERSGQLKWSTPRNLGRAMANYGEEPPKAAGGYLT
jgi:hypothetical protein